MSIYHSRHMRPAASLGVPEPTIALLDDAVPAGEASPAPPAQNLAQLRKATPVEYTLPATLKWLESLPPRVQPVQLSAKYARVANLIAHQWNDGKACVAYLDELLKSHGRRGRRQGFPANIRRELQALREHYMQLQLNADGGLSIT